MRFEKRTNLDGSTYYSFKFYDTKTKKPNRLSREEIRNRFGKDITTEEEAKECLKLLEAQFETEKIRIQRKLSWQQEFYNFTGLLDQYESYQKRRAPNSWQNNVFYMKHYVLPYFLTSMKLNNIELWPDYFEGFREFLKEAKQLRHNKPISYASKNHAIKALNTFLSLLYEKRLISKVSKCETYEEHLTNRRDLDDVIYPKEMESVYKSLIEKGHKKTAVFFRYLFFSGMRLSEGLAISIADVFQGELPSNQFMAKKVKLLGIKYHGYIISDSQVDEKGIRHPFKGKKSIDERFSRIIPIVDKTLWNDLVDLSETAFERWNQSSESKKSCFLFDGLNDATITRQLQEAFESCRLKYRSWHCLRHSRATWLIGETGDEVLARAWLGHSSPRVFERYNHLYQSMVREARSKELVGKEFKLKKV